MGDREKVWLLDATVETMGSPALIVNEPKAKASPCTCYECDTKLICFTEGGIGTLKQDQIPRYCPTKLVEKGGAICNRFKRFKKAISEAKEKYWALPPEKRGIETWLEKAGESLRKRGIEL